MNSTIKYIFWVSEINLEENVLYAEGYKESQTNGVRHQFEIDFDALRDMVSQEDYQELTSQVGRIFEYYLEENEDLDKIILARNPPFTKEQIKEIELKAKKFGEGLKWEE